MERSPLADCTNLTSLKISKPACLAMIASACEVFPKECLGVLCCLDLPNKSGKVMSAFPFQIADRKLGEVNSKSYYFFEDMLSTGTWNILCYYHSHPRRNDEIVPCEPSSADLDSLQTGDLEVIIRVSHLRKLNKNVWKETSTGRLSISWGRFQFLIGAFVRLDDKNYDYRQVSIKFD